MRRKGNPRAPLGGMQAGATIVEDGPEVLREFNVEPPSDPAIPLRGPREMKPSVPTASHDSRTVETA